jgi:hypothetical protein
MLAQIKASLYRMALAACVVAFLLPVAVAYASTIFTYATGTNGVHGEFNTTGFAPRDLNRVWHNAGYFWSVAYVNQLGETYAIVTNSANPTSQTANTTYAKSRCTNQNDNSGTTWTCQTTQNP